MFFLCTLLLPNLAGIIATTFILLSLNDIFHCNNKYAVAKAWASFTEVKVSFPANMLAINAAEKNAIETEFAIQLNRYEKGIADVAPLGTPMGKDFFVEKISNGELTAGQIKRYQTVEAAKDKAFVDKIKDKKAVHTSLGAEFFIDD